MKVFQGFSSYAFIYIMWELVFTIINFNTWNFDECKYSFRVKHRKGP